jgi:hypothetical protein
MPRLAPAQSSYCDCERIAQIAVYELKGTLVLLGADMRTLPI